MDREEQEKNTSDFLKSLSDDEFYYICRQVLLLCSDSTAHDGTRFLKNLTRVNQERVISILFERLSTRQFYRIHEQVESLINKKLEKLPTISADDVIRTIEISKGLNAMRPFLVMD